MSAFADLSLKDQGAVERTFSRTGKDANGVYRWRSAYVTSDIRKQPYVTASMRPVTQSSVVARGTAKFGLPVVDAAGNVTGEGIITVNFALPIVDMTSTDRANILAFVADAINTETPIRNMILNLESIY